MGSVNHTALTSLVDKWLSNIDVNKLSGAVFVDFKKAFDTIHHKLLLQKLRIYRLSDKTIALLESYLKNRLQMTIVNNKPSAFLPMTHGIPQGSVLGPLLFLIYINDLPLSIKGDCELFADDTTLHANNEKIHPLTESLQTSLNNLQTWSDLNHMSVHPDKTKAMLVTSWQKRQNIKDNPFHLHYNNQAIEITDTHKHLGVTIDNNLTWSDHISSISKMISKKLFQLAQIKNFLPQHAKKLFFNAYILSLINYSSTLWCSTSNNSLKPINRAHKRAVKAVLNKRHLSSNDYKNSGILTLKDQLKLNKLLFMHKIVNKNAPNKLIENFTQKKSKHQNKINPGKIPRTDLYKTSLRYSGSLLWNDLPHNLRVKNKINTFRKNIKAHFIKPY